MACRLLNTLAVAASVFAVGGSRVNAPTPSLKSDTHVELDVGSLSPGSAFASAPLVPASFSEFMMSMPDKYNHITYDVEYHSVGEQIMTLPMRRPRTFNVLMATSKTWAADMLVQMAEGRARGVDWRRSAAFAVFGFFYVGLVQWALYVTVMTQLCPNAISFSNQPLSEKMHNIPGQVDLAKQVILDNFCFAVLVYFPVFYIVKELLNGSRSPVSDALSRYKSNFVSDNLASMAFWIPGDILAFAAPIFLRLPIDHSVSFVWTMVLSYKRGGASPALPDSKEPSSKAPSPSES